jgi:flavin-dependent dehydrogenase
MAEWPEDPMTPSPIVIIGAGPAGCIAALLLARAKFSVTLIEQHRFPRDKVCGECLSALGLDVLRRAGLERQVAGLAPVELRQTILHARDGGLVELKLPRPMWGVSRRALDAALLGAARDVGVKVLQPARCETMAPRMRVRSFESNRIDELDPEWVLLADGKGALLPDRPALTGDLGIKAHFRDVVEAPDDAIELFGVDGHYAGLAPIEGGRWNLAFSVPAARVASLRGNLDELLSQMMRENAALRMRLSRATRVGRWLSTALPRSSVGRTHWPPRVVPLGNAAASLEPIGGEGIGLAMRSAELAAAELIVAREQRRDVDIRALRRAFARLWRVRSLACRAAGLLISSPRAAQTIAPLIDRAAPLQCLAMTLLGK